MTEVSIARSTARDATVTIDRLIAAADGALVRGGIEVDGGIVVDGVHVSELRNPTPYLNGGELLLTTGMTLPTGTELDRYVGRLVDVGVAALVLGLGPYHPTVPTALLTACAERGVPLLLTPIEKAFLTVSRAYWQLVAEAGRAALVTQLGAQTTLAREAVAPDGIARIVTTVAKTLGGWAAYLPTGGEPTAWPASLSPVLPGLAAELRRVGARTEVGASSFPLHGYDVIAHPVAPDGARLGTLAVGLSRRLSRTDQQFIFTATALIGLRAAVDRASRRADAREERALVAMLADGDAAAAAAFARAVDRPLPARVRVFATPAGRPAPDSETVVGELQARGVIGTAPSSAGWPVAAFHSGALVVLVPVAEDAPDSSGDAPPPPGPTRGALSAPVRLAELPRAIPATVRRARDAPPGAIRTPSGGLGGRGAEAARLLATHPRQSLTETVTSYLRHRGGWEAASRELGLHRNTVRNRIRMVVDDLGIDVDDPDVAAELWIALRELPGTSGS